MAEKSAPESIAFSYTLTQSEIIDGLKYSGIYKTVGKKAIIETAVLAAFFVFFVVAFIIRGEFFDIVMAVITFLATLAVTALPRLDMRKEAKNGKKEVSLRAAPARITASSSGEPLTMNLDGTTEIKHIEKVGLILLRSPGGSFLIIPERAIPEKNRELVMDWILHPETYDS